MTPTKLHHHVGHPFVVACALLAAVTVLFAGFAWPAWAVTYKAYKHATHGYTFQYPTTWSTTTGTKSVVVKPPSAKLNSLKSQGVGYSLNTAWLNNDPVAFTPAIKNALTAGWTKFVPAYAKALGQKYGATPVVTKYGKTNWLASEIILKRKVNKINTAWRFVVLSRDKKKVFVVAEKWTKNATSPLAADVGTLIKTFTLYTPPDTCGNAIGNGSTIVPGPAVPGAGDNDQTFRSLTVDPIDSNRVFVGTERNGVLYSANGGLTWSRYRQGIRHLGSTGYTEMWDMAIAPTDRARLLLAANDSPGPLAGDYPSNVGGIYLSTNNGQSWARKNCGLTNAQVASIVFSPTNASVALAGGRGGIPSFTPPAGTTWPYYNSGIYRTTDGGTNWVKQTLPGLGDGNKSDFWQIIARGTNPTTYFSFGLNLTSPEYNVGFIKSTDGVNWTAIAPEYRTKTITDFDVSADGQVIIGSVRDANEIVLSTDGGVTWTSMPYSINGVIAISPADSNRVLYSTHSEIWITSDRFASSGQPAVVAGTKINDIVFAPSDPTIVYAVAAGYQFYRSTDAGASFTLVKNLRSEVLNVVP